MKKSVKILLSILCLCPMLLLSACTSSTTYIINVYWSDSTYGSVVGNFTNPRQVEGTTMTLVANENNSTSSTNPFICWIKNDSKVVSTDKELTLTYNSSTQGDYIAVFEETNPSKMIYTSLDGLVISGLDSYIGVTFVLSYATIENSNVFIPFESGSISETGEFISDHTSVLCFGGSGEREESQYRFRIEITSPTEDGTITNTYTSQGYFNNSSFNGQLQTSIVITGINEEVITLNFEKINMTLFEDSQPTE